MSDAPTTSDDGEDGEVYLARNRRTLRATRYHTDPECSHLQPATTIRTIPRSALPADSEECRICSGEATNPSGSGSRAHDLALAWSPDDDHEDGGELVTDGGKQASAPPSAYGKHALHTLAVVASAGEALTAAEIHARLQTAFGDEVVAKGTVSRVVSDFERVGFLKRGPLPGDRAAQLTDAGAEALAEDVGWLVEHTPGLALTDDGGPDQLVTDGGTYERVRNDRDHHLWVHHQTGLRVEALRFGGPVERFETGREPDGLEHWSVCVRPPAKMGDIALEALTDGDRYTEASALREARSWMEAHPDGVPETYTPETAADYHDEDGYRVATDGGQVPPFDRVATLECDACGDTVPIRYLEGDECVGCRYGDRQPVTVGGGDE